MTVNSLRVAKVRNPKTGKMIKVHGSLYDELETEGYKMSKVPRSYGQQKKLPLHADKKVSIKTIKNMSKKKGIPFSEEQGS